MRLILNEEETKEYLEDKRRLKEIYTHHNKLVDKVMDLIFAIRLTKHQDLNKYLDEDKEFQNLCLRFYYPDLDN